MDLACKVSVRVAAEDRARLERLAARVRGARVAQIAREALRLGLELIDQCPERLVRAEEKGPR